MYLVYVTQCHAAAVPYRGTGGLSPAMGYKGPPPALSHTSFSQLSHNPRHLYHRLRHRLRLRHEPTPPPPTTATAAATMSCNGELPFVYRPRPPSTAPGRP